jgi:hypothetical protein
MLSYLVAHSETAPAPVRRNPRARQSGARLAVIREGLRSPPPPAPGFTRVFRQLENVFLPYTTLMLPTLLPNTTRAGSCRMQVARALPAPPRTRSLESFK